MAPGSWPGRDLPGITSSSPVENSATRGRRATCRRSRPMAAARPCAAGPMRSPRASTVLPRVMSSPLRRIHWPAAGTRRMRTRPSSRVSVSSCITIASAPAGTGAPVMRATAGLQGWGAPRRDALAHRQRHAFVGDLRLAHRVAVHRAVVLRRNLQRRDQVLGQHAAVGLGWRRSPCPPAAARPARRPGHRQGTQWRPWRSSSRVVLRVVVEPVPIVDQPLGDARRGVGSSTGAGWGRSGRERPWRWRRRSRRPGSVPACLPRAARPRP